MTSALWTRLRRWLKPTAPGTQPAASALQAPVDAAPPAGSLDRTRQHWDDWQQARERAQERRTWNYTDWGDHPTVFRAVMRHTFGDDDTDFFGYLKTHYPECARGHALSLCCGDGAFEEQLLLQSVFARVTGLELSEQRIAAGRQRLAQRTGTPALALDFLQDDVNRGAFGSDCYDVVFAKAALHHIEALETAFAGMARCLRPNGLLVAIDFFGPTRFQWTPEQLHHTNHFWSTEVPPALRREPDGSPTPPLQRDSVEAVAALDPSEAVRSGEVYPVLQSQFEVLHCHALGGTLLNLLLYGERVNRFDPHNAEHNAVLERAVAYERELLASGALPSDFRFVIARKRSAPALAQ